MNQSKKLVKLTEEEILRNLKISIEKNGLSVDSKNQLGLTPLMLASHKNHFLIVKYLISKRVSLNVQNSVKHKLLKLKKLKSKIEN